MNSKQWYKSKTIWAALVTVVVGTLALAGVGDYEAEQDSIVELIMQLVTLISGAVALVGRVTAKDTITNKGGPSSMLIVMLCGLLVFAGCVTVSPEQAARTRQAAVIVAELNERCQGGDEQACRDGLDAAAVSLDLAADAMAGKGGDLD